MWTFEILGEIIFGDSLLADGTLQSPEAVPGIIPNNRHMRSRTNLGLTINLLQ